MAEICVLGLGYVGLPTASLLATTGYQVLGVDLDQAVVDALNAGQTRLEEAGLATLVAAAVKSGNLVAAVRAEPSDTFVICVPTPVTREKSADLEAVRAATAAVAGRLRQGNLVILESTSPVNTTRAVVGRGLEQATGLKAGVDFDLCYCPERVLPGNTVSELLNNDRVIGGVTPRAAERAAAIYGRFCQGKITLTDDRTAELCKLMENTYRDVNIALANSFARVAEDAGVDVWRAIELANLHPRVRVLKPGPGTGGHCIPVDPWLLAAGFPAHAALVRAAREINDGQPARMLGRLAAAGPLRAGDKLAILGAAYKAGVDDPREGPALRLAHAAREKGLRVLIHDPLVRPGVHDGATVTRDLEACLSGAAAAVLVTDHQQYRGLSAKFFAQHMQGRLIGDCRAWLNHAPLRAAGFVVVALGVG